uniref:Cytochrome P450 n=1 Tax=Cyanothece sp. (strain PCC 7425 / ATCC 29141) TaxID=395961 RepID=B8HVM8_CYAP4
MTLPAGPPTLPLVQLLQWIFTPFAYLEDNQRRYGDIFTARFAGFPPFVLVSDPQAIDAILTAPVQQYDSGRANVILRPTLGDHSLLLLDGELHQRQRQLLMPPLHGERMRAYGQLICQITEAVMDQWQVGQNLTLRPWMQEISLQVILKAVFGLADHRRYQELKQLLSSLLELLTSPVGNVLAFFVNLQMDLGPWSPTGKFLHLKAQIDQLIYAEIAERRQEGSDRSDILSLLLAARDEVGQPMSDQELRDELMTLLIAGHETTATALTWALYWIHRSPEVKARLLVELDSVGEDADPGILAKLPYLNAVCAETLRIYPIALITLLRIARQPVDLQGVHFAPDTYLAPCIYLVHQRPDLYPQPREFRPERFLERQFSAYEYLPFGGGHRRCIGAAFALYEMKLVLATLLRHWQFRLTDSRPVRPQRRGLTMAPAGGVKITAVATTARSPQKRPQREVPPDSARTPIAP